MGAFGQDDRLLHFTSPLGDNVLLPEHLSGVEGVSELFRFQVDLVAAADTTIDPKNIIGKTVTVGINTDDSGTLRYINGVVASFELCGGGDDEFNNYRAYIVPSLWILTLNKNTRVFQNQTVTDVIKAVLSPYKISPSVETSSTFTPMEYCTQYRETDFDFISRLMEQHGILYYFKHSQDDHVFTLQDVSSKLADCAIQNSFRYAPQTGKFEGFYDFVVQDFASKSTIVGGKHSIWDYSFIREKVVPDAGTSAATKGPLGANGNEQYDYADSAAAYLKKPESDGKIGDLASFFMNVRRDVSDAGTVVVEGKSNAIPLTTGFTFTMTEHPQSSLNAKYLLTRVEHDVKQTPSYRTRSKNVAAPYTNTFTAIPSSIPYRPPFTTEKPVVHGMHTGQVVTPSGEDSYMDKYGRVNVQFWWDRLRKANTPDNTLLRVAQSWAGKGWGTYFWPRVGDEVLIDFIEGDPDQPIVVGSVYNGINMPKYDPAGQYTLSGVLTRSSKNGGAANANELRFEDLQGKEQIFMNAERDYDLHVEHDWHTMVGNEQHTTITKNQFEEVDGDAHRLVKGKELQEVDGEAHLNVKSNQIVQVGGDRQHKLSGNLKESIGQDSNISVGQNLNEKVGMNYSLQVGQNQFNKAGMLYVVDSGQEVHIKGGMNVVIEGGMGVCLSGPGGFVSVGPEGVVIQGTLVMINSGGAAIPGSPGMPQSPQSPSAPTAPTAPGFPGDNPPSQAKTSQTGSAPATPSLASGSSSAGGGGSKSPSPPGRAAGAGGAADAANQAAQQATQEAAQAANQAANQAEQAANVAEQAAQQAEQQAQQAVQQVTQQARQEYQQANQAVQQAQNAVNQATAQGKAAAQQALAQAQQQAQQTAQQAAQAVQQAQQQAQQVQQQAQQAAAQAQQQAQQAQQAAQQAEQQAQNAAKQGQQAAQQAQQQAQQAVQQAQQAAAGAQKAAQQAQQQAQQAAQQVQQAAGPALNQARQGAQAAQQSASQAISQAGRGF